MTWRKTDEQLLDEGRREWAFERARLAPHRLPDGDSFELSIEEASGVGLGGLFAGTSGALSDLLTFGSSAGQLQSGAGNVVLVVAVEKKPVALRQHRTRDEAVRDGTALFDTLERVGLEALRS